MSGRRIPPPLPRSTRFATPSSSPTGAPPCASADTRIRALGAAVVPASSTIAVIEVPPAFHSLYNRKKRPADPVTLEDGRPAVHGHVPLRLERDRDEGRGRHCDAGACPEGALDRGRRGGHPRDGDARCVTRTADGRP